MNRFTVVFFVATLLAAASASASMIRAAGAADRQTILLEGGGTLRLRGVDLPVEEELAAREYLQRLVSGLWIYVENGEVYRSPDALFINGEMSRRAWRSGTRMTYLGESFPAAGSHALARPTTAAEPGMRRPHRASRRTAHAPRARVAKPRVRRAKRS